MFIDNNYDRMIDDNEYFCLVYNSYLAPSIQSTYIIFHRNSNREHIWNLKSSYYLIILLPAIFKITHNN